MNNRLIIIYLCGLIHLFSLTFVNAQSTCDTAILLEIDSTTMNCIYDNTINTTFDTNHPISCLTDPIGNLWYKFSPASTDIFQLKTNGKFNDNLTVYTGNSCANLTEIYCTNKDEFGFTGESAFVQIAGGDFCYVRISGSQADFGKCAGQICLEVITDSNYPTVPINDICTSAIPLSVGQPCVNGTNMNANTEGPIPTDFELTRSDVWYSFTPANNEPYTILSHATFSEVLAIYSGTCGALIEIGSADEGQRLQTPVLSPGQIYYIQVAGAFATIEGNFCIEIQENFCQSNLTINSNFINNENVYLEAGNLVCADNLIDTGSNITYDAGNCIQLKPGFTVSAGATFKGFIDGCGTSQ